MSKQLVGNKESSKHHSDFPTWPTNKAEVGEFLIISGLIYSTSAE